MRRFLALLPLLLWPVPIGWADPFKHPSFNFTLEVPPGFIVMRDPQPNVGVLLKDEAHGFPTFNVLLQGGGFLPASEYLEKVGKDTVREYALVGFTDAKLLENKLSKINEIPAQRMELAYSYLGRELIATVWKLSGESEHFILTFIKEREDQDAVARINQVLDSFTLMNGATETARSVSEEDPSYLKALIITFGIVLGLGAVWFTAIRKKT